MSLLVSSGGGGGGPITASDITDSSASGRTVLTSTPTQARTALGFGGTVTVAQLNAAGADARSAMYYCSDCLTVNGPGSLVAWCGRTLTWRTLDDCLLATTSFYDWANDFIKNSNTSELRGTKGLLICALEVSANMHTLTASGSVSVALVAAYSTGDPLLIHLATGTTATGSARDAGPSIVKGYSASTNIFAGVRKNKLLSTATGFTCRFGLASTLSATLAAEEDSICYDAGNVLGALNPSSLQQWLAVIRSGSVNLTGSGATGVSPVAGTAYDASVIRVGDATNMYVDGVLIANGTSGTAFSNYYPFFYIANDGVSTSSVVSKKTGFCYGYLNT